MALWNHIMAVSKADIKRVYDRLNVTFETWEGESDCYKYIPETVEYLEKKGFIEESQGAKVINVSEPVVAYSTRKERPLSSVHDSVHKRVMDTTVSVDEYFDELITLVRSSS